MNTKSKWFDLPVKGESVEMFEIIAVKVFKERFSEETYNRFEEMYFGSDSSSDDDGVAEAECGEAPEVVDGITNALNGVKLDEVVPDDWEDLASDSD